MNDAFVGFMFLLYSHCASDPDTELPACQDTQAAMFQSEAACTAHLHAHAPLGSWETVLAHPDGTTTSAYCVRIEGGSAKRTPL